MDDARIRRVAAALAALLGAPVAGLTAAVLNLVPVTGYAFLGGLAAAIAAAALGPAIARRRPRSVIALAAVTLVVGILLFPIVAVALELRPPASADRIELPDLPRMYALSPLAPAFTIGFVPGVLLVTLVVARLVVLVGGSTAAVEEGPAADERFRRRATRLVALLGLLYGIGALVAAALVSVAPLDY